jgi:2-polyprenyl-3-methyl-5-hydroxy-6-metoxy-1,4-benzoquinol methylase
MPSNHAYHGSLGDFFAQRAENGTYNAYVDRPSMLELAGDVAGQRILDVGCGAGHYAEALVDQGASVLGLEGSAELIAHACTRLGERAEFHQHDLNTPLDTLADASFDGVLCALVLHHLSARELFLREVFRVLRPGGWFALSTSHPTSDWQHFKDSYFSQEWVDLEMRDGNHAIHYQRMTLEMIINEVLSAGFVLERLVEPRPVEALRQVDPTAYADLNQKPSFLALRLRRPG